jgi:hypothetical protein
MIAAAAIAIGERKDFIARLSKSPSLRVKRAFNSMRRG